MVTTKSKITKIVIAVLICFMLCISLFAGCNLIGEDMAKYYNATVAYFTYNDTGETVKITKRDLISAFGTTGGQYYQQTGDAQAAYNQTAQLLVYRKLITKDVEKDLKEEYGEILNLKQKTYLFEMTYQTFVDNVVDYYNDMNGIKDTDEQSDDEVVTQVPFVPQAEYINGEIVLKNTINDEVESHIYFSDLTKGRDVTKQEDMDILYTLCTNYISDNPQYSKAYSKYLSDIKNFEKGMNLSTTSDSIFKRELRRIYDALYENYMLRQYQVIHQKEDSPVTIENMLKKYQNDVANDYNKYIVEKASSYDDDVLGGVENINYFDENGTQFFYVSHLLAKFTTGQEEKYKLYKGIIDGKDYDSDETTQEDSSLDEAKAQVLLNALYDSVVFTERDKVVKEDGSIEWVDNGKTKSVAQVVNELKLALSTCGDDEYKKAEKFTDEFFYKYNQDDAMFSAERNYVIGVDKNGEAKSQMVQEFTDAAISLYNSNNGKIGDFYMPNDKDVKSAMVKTKFGVHIVIYMGRVNNLVQITEPTAQFSPSVLTRLSSNEARLKAGESKTMFDKLFEQLNSDGFAVFQTMNLTFLTNEVDIHYCPDEYADLVSKLK